jgi:phosphatidylglycerophosphate synthase
MKRVLTAFPLVIVSVYTALFAPWWFFLAIVALVAVLCFREYAEITGSFAPLGYVAGILLLVAPQREFILLMILSALAALCLPLAAANPATGIFQSRIADRRHRLYFRILEDRHPAARQRGPACGVSGSRRTSLAAVRSDGELDRRHRRLLHRQEFRTPQAGARRSVRARVGKARPLPRSPASSSA